MLLAKRLSGPVLRVAWFWVLVALLVGVGGGWLMGSRREVKSSPEERHLSGYQWVSPLLACADGANESDPTGRQLRSQVSKVLDQEVNHEVVADVSVYYRDLLNGPWFGIGEDASYAPGSLLKLLLAMAHFLQAEQSPGWLDQQLVFDGVYSNDGQAYPPSQKMTSGDSYTIRELIERMMIYSDNEAKDLLYAKIDIGFVEQVYETLGVPLFEGDEDFISPRQYASALRVLFNATLLTRESSEALLGMMTQAEFAPGLKAGLPEDTPLVQKFGERTFDLGYGESQRQLHNCGIVYGDSPYLLCVMTRGFNLRTQAEAIRLVSETVYAGL